jgi:hypothetical protein
VDDGAGLAFVPKCRTVLDRAERPQDEHGAMPTTFSYPKSACRPWRHRSTAHEAVAPFRFRLRLFRATQSEFLRASFGSGYSESAVTNGSGRGAQLDFDVVRESGIRRAVDLRIQTKSLFDAAAERAGCDPSHDARPTVITSAAIALFLSVFGRENHSIIA